MARYYEDDQMRTGSSRGSRGRMDSDYDRSDVGNRSDGMGGYDRSGSDRGYGDQNYGNRSYGGQSYGGQGYGNRSDRDDSSADQAASGSDGEPSTASGKKARKAAASS